MKKKLLVMLLFVSPFAFSQGLKVISNEQIVIPGIESGIIPVLSPAGDFLLVTGGDMKGLQKYDLDSKLLTTLTQEQGAGFSPQISTDGKLIVFRTREYKGKLRYSSLKSVSVENGKTNNIIKSTRNLEGVNVAEGTVLAVDNGKAIQKRVSGKKLSTSPAICSIREGQLYLSQDKTTIQLSPLGTSVSYLWPSISPDGSKLVFYVMEHGKAYVSNLDGSEVVALGELRAPKWMGNDWVVGMLDKDNGEITTSSKIIAVAADGTNRTELTDDSTISMYPTSSVDGKRIAYNTADGKVFLMEVELNK